MVRVSNLVTCKRCKNVFIAESFQDHVCSPRFRGMRTILVDFCSVGKTRDGQTLIHARGMDGILYSLIVDGQPSIPIPFEPTKRDVTDGEPNDGVTEPASRFC